MNLTRPPRTTGFAPYRLPPVEETTLENGLEVVLVQDQRLPLVTARLGFHAGSKFDPKELAGLSESTGALLTEGTRTRSARRIAEEVAAIGGTLKADSSPDALILGASALADHLPKMLDLMADVARNAVFPPREVALRRQNRRQELLAQRAQAEFLAAEKLVEVLFAPHPYCRQDPTLESIDRLSRASLTEFRDRHLAPNNAVLILLGALPEGRRALDLVRARFGDWKRKRVSPPPPARFPRPKPSITLVHRPGSVQADIRVGRLAVTRAHPDYFPLLVANGVLGGSASSRLFMNIREKKGYAYDAHSALVPLKDSGVASVVTQVRNEVLAEALAGVLAEMRRLGRRGAAAREVVTAKNYLNGVFVIRLETQDGLASQLAGVRLMGLPLSYLERYGPRVRAVEPDRLQAAAAKYFDPEAASIVVVGDADQLAAPLAAFGEVAVEAAR
jgi:zinc protease